LFKELKQVSILKPVFLCSNLCLNLQLISLMKMEPKKRLIIMGIGNFLMGDESVGVHAVQQFDGMDLPEGVETLDGGTGAFYLMSYFETYPKVIIMDATMDGQEPGSIKLIKPKFARDFPKALSTHDVGLKDLLESLEILGKLPEIYLFTITIKKIDYMKLGLTPEVEAALPLVKQKVIDLMNELLKE
jgi:hydrogenase maturation protease